ncbi:TetR/AcrR family transcriptional regulator [Williamsia soli]|uniref:TetR/AcrR family transcriptional regulator n=1 Tax=Williamsia soli TaxID=364929 RepID=UPI001A9F13EC|nr:TetR/AcrR family transcriptional regulator [Williamsia soli]
MAEPKPMSLRDRRRLETRELLVAAAIDSFSVKGFHATSIDDITDQAGTSRATFYAYFDTKDAVLAAVVERMWVEVEDIYAQFGALTDWSASSIGAWLTRFVRAWQMTAARNRVAAEASSAELAKDLPDRYRQLVKIVRSQHQLWAHFTDREADARASMLVLLLQEVLTHHFFEDPEADADLMVQYLTSAARDLLRAQRT